MSAFIIFPLIGTKLRCAFQESSHQFTVNILVSLLEIGNSKKRRDV